MSVYFAAWVRWFFIWIANSRVGVKINAYKGLIEIFWHLSSFMLFTTCTQFSDSDISSFSESVLSIK